MNMTSRIVLTGLVLALAACGKATQDDVDKVTRDGAADVAKTALAAQPAVDTATRDLVKAQNEADAKLADARADANREVNKAARKQSMEQAKADYDVAVARAAADLSVALENCKMQPADAKSACDQNAHSVQDQANSAAKTRLDIVNRQISG